MKSARLVSLAACAALIGAGALVAGRAVADVPGAAPVADAQLGPQDLMVQISNRMFAAIDKNRAEIRKDPTKSYPLINEILLPHFDIDYASQLVLAQYWRNATPDQRKRFVAALYNALQRTYGGALAEFTADRLKILPFKDEPGSATATVRTLVTRSSGAVVPVDYRLHKTDEGWKAYDVVIEGISYVRNYRTDLGAEAGAKGLEAVIARLERDGIDGDQPKPAAH